ncbi:MAG: AMP-binding protein, partial [Planctomycetota bacterium]
MTDAPPIPRFAPAAVDLVRRLDGATLLRSPMDLGEYDRHVDAWLERWAAEAGERVFLAERRSDATGGWRELRFAEADRSVGSLADLLLELGLGPQRPLALLSDNSIDHALLTLAALRVGVPVAPLSPAYSLLAKDRSRLRSMLDLVAPGAVYVDNGELYGAALQDAVSPDAVRLWSAAPPSGSARAIGIRDELARAASERVSAARAAVTPDSIAKLMFTSGSTGIPKAVITTQRMLTSNQRTVQLVWPSLEERPPVLVDWLPWSHCFGGSFNLHLALANGGTFYIDGGKPAPERFGATLENLREIAPTHYFNVPRGFAMLIPALERDDALAATFFSRLEILFYAAAALPQDLWERLDALAARHRETPPALVSAWGSTETAPMATAVHFQIESARVVGLPTPGTELMLVESSGKREVRVKGPQVTPGYWKNPEQTMRAFDAEGFYRIGDAMRFQDEARPEAGLVFDGRVAEDFKLSSGTWVSVGTLRPEFLTHTGDLLVDAVLCGHDRDAIGALCIP